MATKSSHGESVWKVIPFFKSTSIPRTIQYYQELGFELGGSYNHDEDDDAEPTDDKATFCSLFVGPKAVVNIYFMRDSNSGKAMVAFRPLAALDAFYADCQAKRDAGKVTIKAEIEDKAWGYRQFSVEDPDGNELMFFAFLEGDEEEAE